MGIASSSSASTTTASGAGGVVDGEHYVQLVNPQRSRPGSSKVSSVDPAGPALSESRKLGIDPRARLVKRLDYERLWEVFLSSTFQSFALTPAELQSLLKETASQSNDQSKSDGSNSSDVTIQKAKAKTEQATIDLEIQDFVNLLVELEPHKMIDLMAVCSAVLLFSKTLLESKVDQLFSWILLNPSGDGGEEFSLEDFAVALASFDRGVSNCLHRPSSSESFVASNARSWLALAAPDQRNQQAKSNITKQQFFDFCTNRQHVVRRLLESLATLDLVENAHMNLHEVDTDAIDTLIHPPQADEWMANPAWKKTAERMVPPAVKSSYVNAKPASNLELEWVHGYRGYDCRNNVFYLNGQQAAFPAAGLCIAQECNTNANNEKQRQYFFSEHGDDVLCLAVHRKENSQSCLLASGEIGKSPAIYLYSWTPNSQGQQGGVFQSLCCLKGFHSKGVTQLCFSPDGLLLFSVGLEYKIAVYGSDPTNTKTFGKMLASAQGPKEQAMHAISCPSGANEYLFVTCGEKHAASWTFDKSMSLLTKTDIKLGTFKNKVLLSASPCGDRAVVFSTSEGDLLMFPFGGVATAAQLQTGTFTGHAAKTSINVLAMNADKTLLFSGDRDGKVVIWRCEPSANRLIVVWETNLSGCTPFSQLDLDTVDVPKKSAASESSKGAVPTVAKDSSAKSGPIRAMSVSPDGRRLLVGTQRCELVEYQLPTDLSSGSNSRLITNHMISSSVLLSGHFQGEVWGLSVRPVTSQNYHEGVRYATVADDGYLRLWDLTSHKLLKMVHLKAIARCCHFSPDGLYLAVGFGAGRPSLNTGSKGKSKDDGMVKVLRFDITDGDIVVTQVAEIREAKQWISVVRYSPDGTLLAVGSRDNSIYLYSVPNQFKRTIKFSKHNAGIQQLDFSSCGRYMQSCCSSYEILFSDVQTGAQVTDGATKLMDTVWSTWTCTLGWPVIGIWSGTMDGSDVNAVAMSPSRRLLASVDDFGGVNMFVFPAIQDKGSVHNTYTGHSSHVTNVQWASLVPTKKGKSAAEPFQVPVTDDYLISVGGEDKCVFQWKHRYEGGSQFAMGQAAVESEQSIASSNEPSHESEEFDLPSGGDEFLAVKPWVGAIVAPTAWTSPDPSRLPPYFSALGEYARMHAQLTEQLEKERSSTAPNRKSALDATFYSTLATAADSVMRTMTESGHVDHSAPAHDELELEWVHGIRSFDATSRNNLYYVCPASTSFANRLLLYIAASLCICVSPQRKEQRYFRGHTDDIITLATCERNSNPDKLLVATAQQGPAMIYVWTAPDMQTAAVLQPKQKNVLQLAFSGDNGRLLVSIAQDSSIIVIDWQSNTVLVNSKTDSASINGLCVLSSLGQASANSALQFATVADKSLRVYAVNGRNLTSNKWTVSSCKEAKIQQFLSCVSLCGRTFIGCDDGDIYIALNGGKGVEAVMKASARIKGKALSGKSTDAVTALTVHDSLKLLLCGTKGGAICIFDCTALTQSPAANVLPAPLYAFDISDVSDANVIAKQIQSIAVLPMTQNDKTSLSLGIATRGCDLLELEVNISAKTVALQRQSNVCNGVLTRGHCNDELWGVATHPILPEFCTVGDDKTLRFYNLHTYALSAVVPLGFISRTVAYSSDGQLIALGFGGRVGRGKENGDGFVRVYSNVSASGTAPQKLAERKDAKQWISDVKFSPDGRTLVASAHDCKVYIYSVNTTQSGGKITACDLQLRGTFTKHNSVVTHVDLSLDGRFMQSNCAAYELLFCDVSSAKQITSASELRDAKWHTQSCPLGWSVQGIWRAGIDGSDINAVRRSHSGHLLAVVDDFGKVLLYRFPSIDSANSKCLTYSGHSSHVMNVAWSVGDECLLSVGGNDKCVLQWRHRVSNDVANFSAKLLDGGAKDENREKSRRPATIDEDDNDDDQAKAAEENDIDDESSPFEEPSGGDESGAVKPWLGAVRAPSKPPAVSSAAPSVSVSLSWVHGYSCSQPSQRNNVFYNATQQLVYPAAALAVLLDRSSGSDTSDRKQRYFQGHDDDVLCLTMSKCRRFVATGQIASKALRGKASIIVWDALQGRVLSRMDACHSRGVQSLSFNESSNQLMSVGMDDDFTHILWNDVGGNWSRVQQLASAKGDKTPTLCVNWLGSQHPFAASGDVHFISGGTRSLSLWKIQGASLTKKQARLNKKLQSSVYLCLANGRDKVFIGTHSGDLLVLQEKDKEREVQLGVEGAHGKAIHSLIALADGTMLVSGGKDGSIRIWNNALQMTSSFDISELTDGKRIFDRAISSIDVFAPALQLTGASSQQSELVMAVGTVGGDLLEVRVPATPRRDKDSEDGSPSFTVDFAKAAVECLSNSHSSGELWGLATNPTFPDLVATAGDDSILRIWSIKRNRCVFADKLPKKSRSIAWHPLGCVLAVGLENEKDAKGKGKGKGKSSSGGAAKAAPKGGKSKKSAASSETEDEGDASSSAPADYSLMLYTVKTLSAAPFVDVQRKAVGGQFTSVRELKFSPDGLNLFLAAKDCRIHGFALPFADADPLTQSFAWDSVQSILQSRPAFMFDKHSSMVIHFDFTLDGKYLQSNDLGNELLFFDLQKKVQEPSATKVCDYNGVLSDEDEHEARIWSSQTCIFGWSVQGIWPPNAYDSSDINAVDRHASMKYLATSEDSGQVRVLRFPCVTPNASSVVLTGHSSHVTCVRWSGQYLLSTGGNDQCVFVWELQEK